MELVIDEFCDNLPNKINFPNHGVFLGASQSGKSSLIAKMLDNITDVYNFPRHLNGKKSLVIISPAPTIEISKIMTSNHQWDIVMYSSNDFGKSLLDELYANWQRGNYSINILLIEDVRSSLRKREQYSCINELYTNVRHLNVSVLSTMQLYDYRFKAIFHNSGIIVIMYGASITSSLRSVLYFNYKRTSDIVRGLRKCYINRMSIHDYIYLNTTKESFSGCQFYITNNLFNPKSGLTIKQFLI